MDHTSFDTVRRSKFGIISSNEFDDALNMLTEFDK
jgi:hypothetical protein